uniref:protein-tyrosine-phosphatase n=1 Tax=Rhodnius prolixus TaxID=13249 RepID=T1HJ74_RHOPR
MPSPQHQKRTVCQVHYVAWPDHGVPSVVHPLLDMVRLVRDTQASETLPVLVHCSAGCGRTGTICAIDYVFGLLRTGKLTSDFSLSSLIRDMRRQRIAMVQTKEQYVLVHQAVRELFREQLSVIDSHPYENVDPDGSLLIKSDQDNIYDTIDCVEEKGDFKMEKDNQVGVYSNKKNITLYSSKQEKEVENLTEQLRTVQAGTKPRTVLNIAGNVPKSQPLPLVNNHLTKLVLLLVQF